MSPGVYYGLCYYILYSITTLQLTAGSVTCYCFSWWCLDTSLNFSLTNSRKSYLRVTEVELSPHYFCSIRCCRLKLCLDEYLTVDLVEHRIVLFCVSLCCLNREFLLFFSSVPLNRLQFHEKNHFMLNAIWVNASQIRKKYRMSMFYSAGECHLSSCS